MACKVPASIRHDLQSCVHGMQLSQSNLCWDKWSPRAQSVKIGHTFQDSTAQFVKHKEKCISIKVFGWFYNLLLPRGRERGRRAEQNRVRLSLAAWAKEPNTYKYLIHISKQARKLQSNVSNFDIPTTLSFNCKLSQYTPQLHLLYNFLETLRYDR